MGDNFRKVGYKNCGLLEQDQLLEKISDSSFVEHKINKKRKVFGLRKVAILSILLVYVLSFNVIERDVY